MRPLAGLSRTNLLTEFSAGVTLIAIAIPLNIGYAQIAGLPPTAGLYALVVPTIIFALVVSSRQVVASPDAATAALVASSLGGLAIVDQSNYVAMAFAQAVLSGGFFVLAAVFKLGALANLLSHPILVGFIGGLALGILTSQVAKMLGVHTGSGGEFVEKLTGLVSRIGTADLPSIAISAVSVAVLLLGRRWAPAVPWALLVMVGATVVVATTHADEHGVSVLGAVPAGLPTFTVPDLTLTQWSALVPSALALTLVTMAEGVLVSRSYAEKRGYPVDADRDLMAFGLANLASGVQGSFAVGASTSRTAAMDQSGSRTQLPALVLAVGTVLLLLFGTSLLAEIPSPAIGAIVGVAVLPLLGIGDLRELWRLDRAEFGVAAVCFLVTLLVGPLAGIFVSFILALANFIRPATNPPIDFFTAGRQQPSGDIEMIDPGLLVVQMRSPLFFANSTEFQRRVRDAVADERRPVRYLVIDMDGIHTVDVTAAQQFGRLRAWLTEQQVSLAFSRVDPAAVRRLRRLGLLQPDDTLYPDDRAAAKQITGAAEPELYEKLVLSRSGRRLT
ncbi:SulP family inorganic anion transporter [Skermania piniformis]|uniref:SulP family inorganic anion transporter n=2 Tax=Skermania pinensis TaxID=39122 RepID=A0ABX8SAL4_9ACTN|nr:SulP family inorganic anion transporter [Skermania piniformis]QXQ14904.1 SulP family inorganic anion transporter [Skermania piniformis]